MTGHTWDRIYTDGQLVGVRCKTCGREPLEVLAQREIAPVTDDAQGHDELDLYGIPRFHKGRQLTIHKRIELLAEKGDVERVRDSPAVHVFKGAL